MNIKAIQNDCVEEVMEDIVAEEDVVKEKNKEPEVIVPILKREQRVTGLVVNSKTKQSIEAEVLILEYNSISKQKVRSVIGVGFVLDNFNENKG